MMMMSPWAPIKVVLVVAIGLLAVVWATSAIGNILRRGQATGDFRDFDVEVMATTIQRSLDGIPLAQAANPDLDLDVYARELITLFTLATRRQG